MSRKYSYVTCPECEGVGKAINYFDPVIIDKFVVDTKQRRSDGREYFDRKCPRCEGEKTILLWL